MKNSDSTKKSMKEKKLELDKKSRRETSDFGLGEELRGGAIGDEMPDSSDNPENQVLGAGSSSSSCSSSCSSSSSSASINVHIGREGWVGVAFETSPGSGGTDSVKYLPYTSNTLHNVVEIVDDEAAKGVREKTWGSVATKTRGEGDIGMSLSAETLPYFLIPALGTCETSELETGVYRHTVRRKTGNPPTTICLNVFDTFDILQYTYGVSNTTEITFSDGLIETTTGILSKKPVNGSGSGAVDEDTILAFKDAKIYFGSTLIAAEANADAGTGATALTAFTLRISNNAEAQYASGNSSPDKISLGQFEVGGDYTLFFENRTEREYYENQNKRAMVAVFKEADKITGKNYYRKIKICIPKFHLTDRGIDTAPAGFVTENPTWASDYDSTEAGGVDNGSIIVKIDNAADRTTKYTCCTAAA